MLIKVETIITEDHGMLISPLKNNMLKKMESKK